MKRKTGSWLKGFTFLLVIILMTPALGPSEEREAGFLEMQRGMLVKELNLSPDKAKEFLAVAKITATQCLITPSENSARFPSMNPGRYPGGGPW